MIKPKEMKNPNKQLAPTMEMENQERVDHPIVAMNLQVSTVEPRHLSSTVWKSYPWFIWFDSQTHWESELMVQVIVAS